MLSLSDGEVGAIGAGNVESFGVFENVPIAAGGGEEENNGDALKASIETSYAARDLSQS